MKVVVQRVKKAQVEVEGTVCGSIEKGILVFLGIHKDDLPHQTTWLVSKLLNIRIFSDDEGKMNLSLLDIQGEVLIVSQFTLYGNCLEGRRPDFGFAAGPEKAIPIYEKFIREMELSLGKVQTGIFGATMEVSLVNDGPVTFVLER